MSKITNTYLSKSLEDLEKAIDRGVVKSLTTDIKYMIGQIIEILPKHIDVSNLESRLSLQSSIDKESLETLVKLAESIYPQSGSINLGQRVIEPETMFNELVEFVDKLKADHSKLNIEDIQLRLHFSGGQKLFDLLLCANKNNVPLDGFKSLIKEKFSKVSDDVIYQIWDMIVHEFNMPYGIESLEFDSSVVDKDYLSRNDKENTTIKIIDHLIENKPKLVLSMFARNKYSYPNNIPDVLSIIASNAEDSIIPTTNKDLLLGNSISRLACIWVTLFSENAETIATMLTINKDGRLLQGPVYKDFEKDLGTDLKTQLPLIMFDLRRLVNEIELISVGEAQIEIYLWQYKLGIEVLTPEIVEDYNKKNELRLQKELCKFLIERGIHTVGTQFGRSKTDLMTQDENANYIIETKVYKKSSTLSESTLTANFSQLHSYMDQYPDETKGILVIYNFTKTLLETPKQWIHNRFWLLSINLQETSPSSRKRTIFVEESAGNKLIEVVDNKKSKK